MKLSVRICALAMVAALGLTACETPDPSLSLPQITFQHAPPISMAVAGVETVTAYAAPLAAPHVDHRMTTTPAAALSIWARDRLRATDSSAPVQARLTIEQARMIETPLARTQGIRGAFTTDQSHRYDLELKATLELIDAAGQRLGHAGGRATRSQTMPENASLNDLQEAWFEMMEAALQDFDRQMEANVRRFLAAWIR